MYRRGSSTTVTSLRGYRLIQSRIQVVQLARNSKLDFTISEILELIYLNTFDSVSLGVTQQEVMEILLI